MTYLGLVAAVDNHDTATIFDWMMRELSYQGISDAVAEGYMSRHGCITWKEIETALKPGASCDKLETYWTFHKCGYQKGTQSCSAMNHISVCPLPRHTLRNGRLNQTAYSLFLFIRDIAESDIVGWIDQKLSASPLIDFRAAQATLIDPLRNVYGISDKVIAMALSGLLMSAGPTKANWFSVGASFIVVDTLVHNFLHRTGLSGRLGTSHSYGGACYQTNGCADVLLELARAVDARQFNPSFPKVFPRHIQRCVWRYCSEVGLNVCNGNQIDDRSRCLNTECELFRRCERNTLND